MLSGFRFADVDTDKLSFGEFKSFVLYAPPGTAVFHYRNQGWTLGDHLAAVQLDALNWLKWAKTVDGQRNRNQPEPTPRPGMQQPKSEDETSPFTVTVEDYLRMVAEAEEAELEEEG